MDLDMSPVDDRPPVPPVDAGEVPDPGIGDAASDVVPDVDEAQVRRILDLIGMGAHIAVGHPAVEEHWRFTPSELDQLTPPVTAWLNRSPRLRAAAHHGDAVTVAVALGLYTSRNLSISREVADADDADVPPPPFPPDDQDPAGSQPWGEIP